jgi:hypothetical protein
LQLAYLGFCKNNNKATQRRGKLFPGLMEYAMPDSVAAFIAFILARQVLGLREIRGLERNKGDRSGRIYFRDCLCLPHVKPSQQGAAPNMFRVSHPHVCHTQPMQGSRKRAYYETLEPGQEDQCFPGIPLLHNTSGC